MTEITYTKELAHGSFRVFHNSTGANNDDFDAIISVRLDGNVAYLFGAMGKINIKAMRLIANKLISMECDTVILQRNKKHRFPFGVKTECVQFDTYEINIKDFINPSI